MRRPLKELKDWLRVEHRLFLRPRVVISFPKSGRTWLHVMLDQLGIPTRFVHADADKATRLADIDRREARRYRRALILLRDPRDTAVSWFHHVTRRMEIYSGDLSAFLRDPRFGVEKIARHNLLWAELSVSEPHMALLTYERLRNGTSDALADVAAYFGQPRAPEAIAPVVADNELERMRRREQAGDYVERYGRKLSPINPDDPDSFKIRHGRVGGYALEMTPDDVAFCDATLEGLDYGAALEACLGVAAVDKRKDQRG